MPQEPGFFEFRERLTRPARPAPVTGGAERGGAESTQPLTVSQLTQRIEAAIRSGVPGAVAVRGEISNFNHHRASGHFYFTLKDPSACIDCVMFRGDAGRLKFQPTDGMDAVVSGAVKVYAQRGRYQLYVSSIAPVGAGALELALRQLREKLQREGLFDPDRKRPLPLYPRRVAVVTGRETAALHDILKVLRRFACLDISVFNVPVQGDGAAGKIAEALRRAGAGGPRHAVPDVVVLARGGGSLEDLWAFNEEVVARAVAACPVPVVSGIGHEIDVSIADLVADHHAHTPTEAAQTIVAGWRTAADDVIQLTQRLDRALRQCLLDGRRRLERLSGHELFRRPGDLVDLRRQWLDDRQKSLLLALSRRAEIARRRLDSAGSGLSQHHPRHRVRLLAERLGQRAGALRAAAGMAVERLRRRIDATDGQLRALSPQATLGRGYSITRRKSDGVILRAAADIRPGDVLLTRFSDGEAESVVRDQKQMRLFEGS